ncbi:hypothetical protein DPMN_038751 [Dreissena polymorpha]|uniref:Uncharacterized protein n=1 Tax=Dreissena polymorpha TaxID=45954 RepID=A0A9D4MG17_DREPO|nr:hypothetical protein DPMN_038751 [Dreissena polymorpha]
MNVYEHVCETAADCLQNTKDGMLTCIEKFKTSGEAIQKSISSFRHHLMSSTQDSNSSGVDVDTDDWCNKTKPRGAQTPCPEGYRERKFATIIRPDDSYLKKRTAGEESGSNSIIKQRGARLCADNSWNAMTPRNDTTRSTHLNVIRKAKSDTNYPSNKDEKTEKTVKEKSKSSDHYFTIPRSNPYKSSSSSVTGKYFGKSDEKTLFKNALGRSGIQNKSQPKPLHTNTKKNIEIVQCSPEVQSTEPDKIYIYIQDMSTPSSCAAIDHTLMSSPKGPVNKRAPIPLSPLAKFTDKGKTVHSTCAYSQLKEADRSATGKQQQKPTPTKRDRDRCTQAGYDPSTIVPVIPKTGFVKTKFEIKIPDDKSHLQKLVSILTVSHHRTVDEAAYLKLKALTRRSSLEATVGCFQCCRRQF